MHVGLGGDIIVLEGACFGSDQGASVELAVLVDGQLVELDKESRDHIRRQLLRDGFPEIVRLDRLVLYVIGNKIHLSVLVLEVLDRRVVDAVALLDDGFDLARLNALTVDFHHPVLAVEVDDIAVLRSADDIAGPEQLGIAVLFGKGVVDKGFGGLLRQMEIAVGKNAGKAQLAFLGFVAVFVQNMRAYIAERLADRRIIIGLVDLEGEHRRSGLCLTVKDVQFIFVAVGIGNALAAGGDYFQAVALLLEYLEHFGADKGAVDLIVLDKIRQQHRIAHCLVGHQVGSQRRA